MLQFLAIFLLCFSFLFYKADSPLIIGYRFVKSYSCAKISHHNLEISALPENKEVKIKCQSDFILLNNTDKILIFLNSHFKIKNIKREKINLKFQRWNIPGVFVSLYWVYLDREFKNNENITLTFEYSGVPFSFSSGFEENRLEMDIYSFFYPVCLSENFFSTDISITVLKNQKVIANGVLYKIEKDVTTDTYYYKTTTPVAVISVVAGEFLEIKKYLGEKVISIYYSSDYKDIIPEVFEYSSYILNFFENKFGKLPFKSLKIVLTERENAPCYSSYNIVVINKGSIELIKKEQENFSLNLFSLLAHEISHQYWGNSVAPDIKEGWILVEGLAEYSCLLAIEEKFGKEKFKERMEYDYNLYRKNVKEEKPLSKPYLFLENPSSLYYKGALVFHLIREKTGKENFFLILREYFSLFSGKFANLEDFQRISKKYTQEVDFIFKEYVRGIKKIELNF